jgi:hypothetical protein
MFLKNDDVVEMDGDTQANVMLMDDSDYSNFGPSIPVFIRMCSGAGILPAPGSAWRASATPHRSENRYNRAVPGAFSAQAVEK